MPLYICEDTSSEEAAEREMARQVKTEWQEAANTWFAEANRKADEEYEEQQELASHGSDYDLTRYSRDAIQGTTK